MNAKRMIGQEGNIDLSFPNQYRSLSDFEKRELQKLKDWIWKQQQRRKIKNEGGKTAQEGDELKSFSFWMRSEVK